MKVIFYWRMYAQTGVSGDRSYKAALSVPHSKMTCWNVMLYRYWDNALISLSRE